MANQQWTTQARIEGKGRGFLITLFWFWGIIGLLLNVGSYVGLSGNIGVGTSAYLILGVLLWIGGMLLFGLGAAALPAKFDFNRPVSGE